MILLKIDGFGHQQIKHLRIQIGVQVNQMVAQDRTASLFILIIHGSGLTWPARIHNSLSVRKSKDNFLLTLLYEIIDEKLFKQNSKDIERRETSILWHKCRNPIWKFKQYGQTLTILSPRKTLFLLNCALINHFGKFN